MGLNRNLRLWLAGAFVASAVGVLLPEDIGLPLVLLWALACSISLIRAARRQADPQTRSVLKLLAAVAFLIVIGQLVRGVHGELIGVAQPMPSPADIIHIPAYILFGTVVLRIHLARATRRDPDAWLDAAAICVASAIVVWTTFLGDFIQNESIDVGVRTLNTIYNLLVLAAVSVFVRIMATPGSRPASYYLLGLAGGAFLVADLAASYSVVNDNGVFLTVGLSPLVMGLCVVAARHDSVVSLLEGDPAKEVVVGPARLTMVALTTTVPMIGGLIASRTSDSTDFVLLTGSVVLAVVVVARVLRLLVSQQDAARIERRLAAEVAGLAALESSTAIRTALPEAAVRVVPSLSASKAIDVTSADAGPERVLPSSLTPTETRALENLVRDAQLLADSNDGIAAQARQASERQANERIAQNERRFRALVQHSSDIIVLLDDDARITYVSESVERVVGSSSDELIGTPIQKLLHKNDRNALQSVLDTLETRTIQQTDEFRLKSQSGRPRLFEVTVTDMRGVAAVAGIVLNCTDITETRNLENDLRDANTIDRLTGLINRQAFIEQLDLEIRRTDVTGVPLAIALIDLNDFKSINDGLGPVHADAALVECGQRIRQAVRLDDTVARVSGDEYAVLMPDGYTSAEAVNVVSRVLEAITEPFEVQGITISLSATAGVAINAGEEAVALDLMRNADTALTLGKEANPGTAVLFQDEMGEEAVERVELRNSFLSALDNEELRLVYQPIISMETGEIVSMEALSRWTHPERGPISPGIFIPIAEESDAIDKLGLWAMRSVCSQLVAWQSLGHSGFTVSVNLSGQQLRDDRIVADVARILEETGADPNRLVIEITESVLIDNTDLTASRIQAIRELGVQLAIDDFGTGYSSLSYLQRYEFDVLKIDRSFVVPLGIDAHSREREVVASIIGLAKGLGAVTVAEGIEKHPEFTVLRELGCDYAQGFLFFYPLEIDDVTDALTSTRIAA